MTDFIEIYPDALSTDFCQQAIERFERSPRRAPGVTGQGVDRHKKDSLDILIDGDPEWRATHEALMLALARGLRDYVRKHPFLVTGPVAPSLLDPESGQARPIGYQQVAGMDDAQLTQIIQHIYRPGTVNLQKYAQGRGGYHHWHSEIYPHPRDPAQDSLHRVLVFMFYLNDVAEGGETSFFFQQRSLKPRQGDLVLFPAGFTHSHKGEVPRSGDKYIFTSWLLYQPAARLYQAG